MGRTIVIGDIHGCYDELLTLLRKVELKANDRVVAVGDLVVKGPRNRQVLDLFSGDSRFSSVIGNQDLALLQFWAGKKIKIKEAQMKACEDLGNEDSHYYEYLRSLPFLIDLGDHVVVHAGLRPGVPLANQAMEDLTELRTLGPDRTSRNGVPWYEVYEGKKIALFGHWPAPEPRRGKFAIGLDTGCVYGYRLTAYIVETAEFVSVGARRVYAASSLQTS